MALKLAYIYLSVIYVSNVLTAYTLQSLLHMECEPAGGAYHSGAQAVVDKTGQGDMGKEAPTNQSSGKTALTNPSNVGHACVFLATLARC